MMTILRRSMSSMTYSSLCIPDDIAERGLHDVPNFYYRDDGLRLWDIIYRYYRLSKCDFQSIHDKWLKYLAAQIKTVIYK